LFRLLGLVPGTDVTRHAAAALAEITAKDASTLLDRLVAAHLIYQRTPDRFGMHSLLRLYAAERCAQEEDERGRTVATKRLLDWQLQAADAAAWCLYPTRLRLPVRKVTVTPPAPSFTSRAHALEWLDAERATLVALTRHAAEVGQRQTAWLLADTLRGYFWLRMCLVDWLATAQVGLAAAEADVDLPAQAAAQLSLGEVYQDRGEHEKATGSYRAALSRMRETGSLEGQASVLNNLGIVHRRAGRLRKAEACCAEAAAINRQIGSVTGLALNLINLGRAMSQASSNAPPDVKLKRSP
jgi:tetratricopeptide (TPR) repeat protein